MAETYSLAEQSLLQLLSDGEAHTKNEIREFVYGYDESTSNDSIRYLVWALRKKLKPLGQDIVSVTTDRKKFAYRHMRLLRSE